MSEQVLMQKANKEHWKQDRDAAISIANAQIQQKAAKAISDNAKVAADLKRKLLDRLKRMEEKYPLDATEVRTKVGTSTAIYRIKDLTSAYRDLTEDMNLNTNVEPVRIIIDV